MIAREIGCSKPTVRKWLVEAGVEINVNERLLHFTTGSNSPQWKGGSERQHRKEDVTTLLALGNPVCNWCGVESSVDNDGPAMYVYYKDSNALQILLYQT